MKKVGDFYKVSFSQFEKDYNEIFGKKLDYQSMKKMYDGIKMPTRATTGSAGYDIFLPFDITLKAGEEITIPSGIGFTCKKDYALFVLSKSGLGSRSRLQLNTCISLIDSDYHNSDNEGHMIFRVIHDSRDPKAVLTLPAGKGFLQGVFFQYGITKTDNASGTRNGGLGSTNS